MSYAKYHIMNRGNHLLLSTEGCILLHNIHIINDEFRYQINTMSKDVNLLERPIFSLKVKYTNLTKFYKPIETFNKQLVKDIINFEC